MKFRFLLSTILFLFINIYSFAESNVPSEDPGFVGDSKIYGWMPLQFDFPDKSNDYMLVSMEEYNDKPTILIRKEIMQNQMDKGKYANRFMTGIGVDDVPVKGGNRAFRLENIWGEKKYYFVSTSGQKVKPGDNWEKKTVDYPTSYTGNRVKEDIDNNIRLYNGKDGVIGGLEHIIFQYPSNWAGDVNTADMSQTGYSLRVFQTGLANGAEPNPGTKYKGSAKLTYNYFFNVPVEISVRVYHYHNGTLEKVLDTVGAWTDVGAKDFPFEWTASNDPNEQLVAVINGAAKLNEQGQIVYDESGKYMVFHVPGAGDMVPINEEREVESNSKGYDDNIYSMRTHVGNLTAKSIYLDGVPTEGPLPGKDYPAMITFKNSSNVPYNQVDVRGFINGAGVTLYSANTPVSKLSLAPGEEKTLWFPVWMPNRRAGVSFGGDINLSGMRQPEKNYEDNTVSGSTVTAVGIPGVKSQPELVLKAYSQDFQTTRNTNTAKWTDAVQANLEPVNVVWGYTSDDPEPDHQVFIAPPPPPSGDVPPGTAVLTSYRILDPVVTFPQANPYYSYGHPLDPTGTINKGMANHGTSAEAWFEENWSHAGAPVYDLTDGYEKDADPASYPVTVRYTVEVNYEHHWTKVIRHSSTDAQGKTTYWNEYVPMSSSGTVNYPYERRVNLLVNGTGAATLAQ